MRPGKLRVPVDRTTCPSVVTPECTPKQAPQPGGSTSQPATPVADAPKPTGPVARVNGVEIPREKLDKELAAYVKTLD